MKIKAVLQNIIVDLLLLVGIASLLYGINEIYTPAAFIVFGTLLIIAFRPIPNKTAKLKQPDNRKK